jgi:hypothetical protein
MTVSHSTAPLDAADRCLDFLERLPINFVRKPLIARSVEFCDRGEVVVVFYLESHEV